MNIIYFTLLCSATVKCFDLLTPSVIRTNLTEVPLCEDEGSLKVEIFKTEDYTYKKFGLNTREVMIPSPGLKC